MKELSEILAAVDAAAASGEPMALATIISVRGSTYRRAGARLLITQSGQQTGNISGGCLEGDVAVVAKEVLERRAPRLMRYDLTADDDPVWGLGLGCNGAIEVFVEPTTGDDLLWRAVRATLGGDDAVVIASVVEGTTTVPAGRRVVRWPDGRRQGSLGDAAASLQTSYKHARGWCAGFEVPCGIPHVQAVSLRGSVGRYRVDSDGYIQIEISPEMFSDADVAESHLTRTLFRQIIGRIERLAWLPT